jgi:hypothetical protein
LLLVIETRDLKKKKKFNVLVSKVWKKIPKNFCNFFQVHTKFFAPKIFKIIYYHNAKIQLEKENV